MGSSSDSFGDVWHPLIARMEVTGAGVGQLRTIETIDGKEIIERLEAIDDSQRLYRYTMISGIPAANYVGTLDVKPKGSGNSVQWRVQFRPDGQPDIVVKTIVAELLKPVSEALNDALAPGSDPRLRSRNESSTGHCRRYRRH